MPVKKPVRKRAKKSPTSGVFRRMLLYALSLVAAAYVLLTFTLVVLRLVDPPFTSVQIERRLESWAHHKPYHKVYEPVALNRISPGLQHAVVSAEDARFYEHHGFDWKEIQIAAQEDLDDGRRRGASTITQQLVKNLFLFTASSWVRKGIEFTMVPFAETILGKRRILELYLNVIEWGPGVYGAEGAAETWFHVSAASLTRAQCVELAAMLPAPLHRRPGRTPHYVAKIDLRMRQAGW